ncbi:MAG: ABC transporter ATP-binding protein [Clostridia bacterium]|nr:ABC transporter ATP-binding protein [Clostridia bacterium]
MKKYFARKGKALVNISKQCLLFVKNPIKFIKNAIQTHKDLINDVYVPLIHKSENVLEVNKLKMYFPIKSGFFKRTVGYVKAVDGITFNIEKGKTMGLVGESGCGKTTVGRTILRLYERTGGEVLFDGEDINRLSKKRLRAKRPELQIVFQDPYSSLSPRLPVGEIIGEAVREHKIVSKEQFDGYITKIMNDCGLQEYHKDRYPHEFSGGQRQRICIARALALNPKFIICDEPVSALDVSIQAQIINLLKDLQKKFGLTYLFISHDLSVVEHISDTVGVMYLGNLVEYADTKKIFENPKHPYTEALFSAIPVPDPNYKMKRIILEGSIPSPANPPGGCKFHTRCRKCMEICKTCVPNTIEVEENHYVVCHLFDAEAMERNEELVKSGIINSEVTEKPSIVIDEEKAIQKAKEAKVRGHAMRGKGPRI